MGLVTLEGNIAAAGGNTTLTRDLNPGILTAVSVNGAILYIPKGQTMARVTLRRGGADEAWVGITLIDDYVYHNFSPSWSGLIYIEPNDVLYFYLQSSAADRAFCAALTTRWQQVTLGGEVIDVRPSVRVT